MVSAFSLLVVYEPTDGNAVFLVVKVVTNLMMKLLVAEPVGTTLGIVLVMVEVQVLVRVQVLAQVQVLGQV